MRIGLAALFFVCATASAGESAYFCLVEKAYSVDVHGELGEHPTMSEHLGQQRFSVDRATGQLTAEFHTNTSPIVVWNPKPGDGNGYLVIDRSRSVRAAFTSSLVVEEFVDSNKKPFLWQWGSIVISGICE